MGALAGEPSEQKAKAMGPFGADARVGDRGTLGAACGSPLGCCLACLAPPTPTLLATQAATPHFPGANAPWTRPGEGGRRGLGDVVSQRTPGTERASWWPPSSLTVGAVVAGGAVIWGLEELVSVVRGPGCWSLCAGLAAPQSERRAFWIEFSMISRWLRL